ncbi:inactive histone-lysine N-methyltransferase 2E-like [Macrosteles quadrilineatus]|uniref:inactive histone-lysine N-methyltransferase 2E-like n=1 Tax=Macrosteles quadrilineatus TaxID=74068 RepID=UPI0023E17B55|nr:inactive histone-lysine N-methyltransferase 2E-like [Macrosteles quadrilineatus]XP_054289298.1 inactive histone-lysine N-methyltransferase 2E-like [Macrosteles quadrilineatus]
MVPRLVATSATIIPCGGNAPANPLSIPVKSNQQSDEGMSLIVQLGTTNVGYTPTLTTAVVSSSNTSNRSVNLRAQVASAGQQPPSVAKHRLPMQINRQPQQVNRSLQHTALPARNIAALARPINNNHATPPVSQSAPSPTIAGRVLASPVKDSTLDDDLLEGVVEKRPKYHKHLPLNYQYVLQDHNYGAPPPPTPNSPPKPLVNGVATTNGLTRSQPPISQQPPNNTHYAANTFAANRQPKNVQPTIPPASTTFGSTTMSNVFGIGTRGPVRGVTPAEESDVESTDGEREVDPQGEETETAPEGEDNEDDSVTRCICDFQHDDGYMICCDKCSVWQHVDCMGIDRANIPEEYMCEKCQPRRIDKQKAIALQMRKKKELLDTSDSSSDTSSGSDTNVPPRKPGAPANNRKPAQRKNITTGGKQRRESNKDSNRQNNRQVFRKKQTEKRPPLRRKSSQPSVNNNPPAAEKSSPVEKKPPTPVTPVEQLRQWIDSYEEAVTNHYSPELRARVAAIKVNGVHSDLKLPTNLLTTPKYRISLLPSGVKILVATVALSSNQPLVELRGKYMLCGGGANRPLRPPVPPPGPYIFHYKLPRDNTEVCVDARTYGNDARFVRRSCKPNAEVRHCIEKGVLHLYLVTTKAMDKNTEITLAMGPGLVCASCLDNPCPAAVPLTSTDNHKILNGLISPNNNNNNVNTQISDKRRRGRRRTVSENLSPPKASPKPTPKPQPSKAQAASKVSPTPKPTPKVVPSVRVPTPPPRVPTPPPPPEPEVEKPVKAPTPPPSPPAAPSPPPPAPTTRSAANNAARKPPPAPTTPKKKEEPLKEEVVKEGTKLSKKEAADKKNKMTREERKMEAIMKAFERMEKDQARKQEAQARQTHRKDSTETDFKPHLTETKEKENKEKDKSSDKEDNNSSSKNSQRKRKFTVTKRKGRGRSQSTPQPVLRPRRTLRRSQPTRERSPDSAESSDDESPLRQRPNRTPTPPPARRHTPPTTPTQNNTTSTATDYKKSYESPPPHTSPSSGAGDTPPTPMSKTAMLIAAAVGPLAPGFKFPKTKKGILTSWLNKSPESSPPAQPEQQGYNAKKRWLRQAISEECDSPNSRPDVTNSPSEHVAPPKKRRMARESISEDHSVTPPTTPTHTAEALSQMTDEEDTVSSPQDNVKPAQESHDEVCGSSQESEGPDSPTPALKSKTKVKKEAEEETEESEGEQLKPNVCVKEEDSTVKDDFKVKEEAVKEEGQVKCKTEAKEGRKTRSSGSEDEVKKTKTAEQSAAAAATAIKRKLSISEYRQRRQQGGGSGTGQGTTGKSGGGTGGASSPPTSATSSMSSSSSEDEEEPQPQTVIAKSLMLEAALDTNLAKKPPTNNIFSSAPTLVERQRENLTQRLKREFGLFLSDDEEQEKARKQANIDSLNKQEKEKELGKKMVPPPPPPPPADPPAHYGPLYFPGVGHPMYSNRYPPATAAPTPFYNPGSSYYQH